MISLSTEYYNRQDSIKKLKRNGALRREKFMRYDTIRGTTRKLNFFWLKIMTTIQITERQVKIEIEIDLIPN